MSLPAYSPSQGGVPVQDPDPSDVLQPSQARSQDRSWGAHTVEIYTDNILLNSVFLQILTNPGLKAEWLVDVKGMADRYFL